MKSIKQQYIDLREGNMSQANFMRNLRMTMPHLVTNITSFEDSVRILKNKGILTEMLDPNAAEEIALAAGSYEAAVDKLIDMGLSSQEADKIANELYPENEDFERDYDADYEEPYEPFDMAEAKNNSYADVVNAISKKYSYKVYHDEIEEFMHDKDSLKAILAGKDPIVAYEEFYNIQRKSLNEAKDNSSEGKYKKVTGKDLYAQFKELDNLNGHEVAQGIDWEMQCNPELPKKDIIKKVIKNLKKNPIYYTSWDLSGVEGYEPEIMGPKADIAARQMQPLEKNLGNVVDKKMGMKPIKDVEKVKKDADAKKETNKPEKGITLMSLIAKTVRGMKKMDATGEKMKKVSMNEVRLNDFPGETPGKIATQIKNFVDSNPTLKQYSDEITLQSDPDGFLRFGYWDSLPSDAVKALELQFDVEEDSDFDEDKGTLIYYKLTPKHSAGTVNLGKADLMNMIREEIKEMFDGRDNMTDVTGENK